MTMHQSEHRAPKAITSGVAEEIRRRIGEYSAPRTIRAKTETVRFMAESILGVLEVYGRQDFDPGNVDRQHLWSYWHMAYGHRTWTDDHPVFATHPRVLERCDCELYPDGMNDRSMDTALGEAFRLLFPAESRV
jgi:hypothetical protein